MKKTFFLLIALATTLCYSQEDTKVAVNLPANQKYEFTTVIDIEASNVKSQGNTGTCWSYASSSFIESEIYRVSGEHIDISEMYNVRQTYPAKAWNYVMRQGKTQFGEGGLAHDVMNSVQQYGLVPESAFSGLQNGSKEHNHEAMATQLKEVLDTFIKNDVNSKYPNWKKAIGTILDEQLGTIPTEFNYNGIQYTPMSFLKKTQLHPADYITLTSFTHQPYYTKFILNIPDNFSNGSFYNVPLNDLVSETDNALKNGYTLALDCDVSEATFSSKTGVAFIPKNNTDQEKGLTYIVDELPITADFRQQEFENYNTADDHLMHLVGLVKDQNNKEYYKIKNSWGGNSDRIGNNGYIYMSKTYFKLKTISVLVHKNGVSPAILNKFK
ncbi:MAG: aminopeptidase [Lutibacter sp.]|nr:aminopeptidase [Lutibacter sp.]